MRNQHGFSLIEILIALSILAIALTASLLLMTRGSKNLIHTQDYDMALWVAENTLAKIQMGTLKLQDDRPATGSVKQLHQSFSYKAVAEMQYAHADEIKITVGLKDKHALLSIKGWYWHPQGDQQ